MAAFVTVSDYLAYFGDVDSSDLWQIEANLDEACDKVRDYLCQTVDLVTNDVVTVYGTDTRAMLLPELPVVSIASVVENGTAVTDYIADQYGILWRTPSAYWPRSYTYTVTYTHGYAAGEVPAILKSTALRLARSAASRPDGVSQESVAGYSATYVSDGDVLKALDRRRVPRVPLP